MAQLQLSGRNCLRQGGKMHTMKALLFVPADRSTGPYARQGQVLSLIRSRYLHMQAAADMILARLGRLQALAGLLGLCHQQARSKGKACTE